MNSLRENEYSLKDAAKVLNMPQTAFIDYMIKMKYLQREHEKRIVPTREAYLRGDCKVHASFFDNGFREVKTKSTRITGRCLSRLREEVTRLTLEALPASDDDQTSGQKLINRNST